MEWSIVPATLTATFVSEVVIEGASPALEVEISGFVNGETPETAKGFEAPTVVATETAPGEYILTPMGGSAKNYVFEYVAGTLTICQTVAIPVMPEDLVYNGNTQIAIPYDDDVYDVVGGFSADAGKHEATVTLRDGYAWEDGTYEPKSFVWYIAKAVLTATYVSETVIEGSEPALKVDVQGFLGMDEITEPEDYVAPTVTAGSLEPGEYTLTPEGGSAKNYDFEYVSGILKVIEVEDGKIVQIPSAPSSVIYNGAEQTIVSAGEGYTVTGGSAKDVGEYAAILSLEGGYVWSDATLEDKTLDWSIDPATLTARYVSETIVVGAQPALKVSVTGFVGGENASTAEEYVAPVASTDKTAPGTYTFTPYGGSAKNYDFKYVSGTLTILGSIEKPVANEGLVYTGKPLTGVDSGEGYTVSNGVNVDVGIYRAVAIPKSGYVWSDGTAEPYYVMWGIASATLTATYISETIVEGETPALKVAVTGFVNGETPATIKGYVAPTVEASDLSEGFYQLRPSGGTAQNYTFKYLAGSLTVEKYVPDIVIDVPKAKIGLVCNGSMQTGVPDGEGYTISGNTSRSAGGFVAVLTLEDGYGWSDGTYEDKEVAYFISPLAIGGFLTDEQKRKFFPFWSGR